MILFFFDQGYGRGINSTSLATLNIDSCDIARAVLESYFMLALRPTRRQGSMSDYASC